jgi:glucokinase
MLLAGDLGGTKTNLAIISPAAGPREPVAEGTLPSANYASLEALIRDFLKDHKLTITSACFGVAGPVVEGVATITNLPWVIREPELASAFSLKQAKLLNDLAAIASSVPFLGEEDLHTLSVGRAERGGTIAVIAPGTGLGEAFLTWDGARYLAFPSEGGHAEFAPTNALQIELLEYLLQEVDLVSYERVCSGRGIPNIYNFIKGRDGGEPDWLARRLAAESDPTPSIMNAALQDDPPKICRDTLELFVDIMVAEAGNLALKTLATGGVYLGGGIPPRLLSVLTPERVLPIFQHKGRLSAVMHNIPLHVIDNPKAALWGAAYAGLAL